MESQQHHDPVWVIDLEASGLHHSSYPIEVGLVAQHQHYQALICPQPSWQFWSEDSQKIHGLARDTLIRDGEPAKQVALMLNTLLAGGRVYSDCAHWDGFWLDVLFHGVGVQPTFEVADIAVLLDASHHDCYLETYHNLKACGQYQAHRALDDAQVIHHALTAALASQ